MKDFKKQSKFLDKFPAQPYLGYFKYQLTKYQYFQIYYIIITTIIIVILLSSLLLLLLSLFLLKFWSVVGLWGFRFHQFAFKPSHKEVLVLTCGRLLPTHFCLQLFFHKDSVALLLAQFYLYIEVSSQLINASLTLFLTAETQLVHRLSGAAAIYLGSKSFFRCFEEKLTKRVKLKRLSFTAQFKIDFLLPFTGCKKVLRKMSALSVSRQISFPMLLT